MRFLIIFLFFFSASLFSSEYIYNSPVGVEIKEGEFANWQQALIKQEEVVNALVQSAGVANVNTRYLNRLIYEASPYLLRHSLNPINWYPWQVDALAKAKRENKLIFVSIGYSTCHWCHVMEKESFTKKSIAEVLNQDFVSIKVDRELTPDVDQYFTRALELTKGSAGWPINAILTPDAEVVWLDSYLSPESFVKVINQLSKIWQSTPQKAKQVAKNLAGQLRIKNNSAGITWHIEKSEQAVKTLIKNLDTDHGGLSGDRKFPNASALQLLIYQYQLTPDPVLGRHIKHFLNQLASKGIRDHVHGGFYRYSTDTMWHQPHFEKMLYNQALLISTFSKAYQVFKDDDYRLLVIDTINFVQEWFKSPEGGYYSGIDADYLGREGLYYVFSPQELASIDPVTLNQFSWCDFNTTALKFPCSFSSVGERDSARQVLYSAKSELAKPHIDKKVITAWNALMLSAFVDAYTAFKDPRFLSQALDLAKIIKDNHIDQSGTLIRARYLDKVAVDAVINDYAYLASAMFTLFQETQDQEWYQLSVKLYQQGSSLFGKNYQGYQGIGNSELDDGELISAHTVLVSLGAKLRRYGEKNSTRLTQQLSQLQQAAMVSSGGNFSTHELFLKDIHGVFDNKQFFAKGKGQIQLSLHNNRVTLSIQLAKGWHINSNQPNQKFLIPTKLHFKGIGGSNVEFPEASIKTLGFNQSALSLFEGRFEISANIDVTNELGGKVQLNLQACSDKVCLLPEKLNFYIKDK